MTRIPTLRYSGSIGHEIMKQTIMNLKQRRMSFEKSVRRVIQPLDPTLGERFVEPVE